MASTVVRISESSHQRLRKLARSSRTSMQEVLDRAIDEYERNRFFDELNEDFAALRSNPEAWAEYREEALLLENTLMDGLERDETWGHDRTVTAREPTEARVG